MVVVKRDKPRTCGYVAALFVAVVIGSIYIHTAVVFEGKLLLGSACVPPRVYCTLAAAAVVLGIWVCRDTPGSL